MSGYVASSAGHPPVADGAATRSVTGERVAIVATAVAVATLPLAVPTGPANAAPIDACIALALGMCLLWARSAGWPWRVPYMLPMGLLLAGGALGALMGPVPGPGFVALVQDLVLILWCWVVVNMCHSAANLRIVLTTWAYSGIAWAVLAFVGIATGASLLTGHVERQGTRLQITLADPSYAANYFFISIMIIWACQRPRSRIVRVAAYALLVAAIAMTASNSGIVALILGTLVAAVLGVYRRFGLVPASTMAAFAVLGAVAVSSGVDLTGLQDRAHESRYGFVRQGVGRSPQSVGQREALWQESIRLYRTGSPLGEGPVSTKPRLASEMAPLVKEAHNDYLAALIERGAIGFLGVLLLLAGLALRSLLVTTATLAEGFATAVVRPNALVGAVAGTLVAGTVYELLHVRHVWALFGLLAAICIWGRR